MKKILIALTLFISIFAFSDIKAQHSFTDKVQFGVRVGGNWSSSSLYANDWREFGFNAGFIAEYRINSSFALAVELGYSLETVEMMYTYNVYGDGYHYRSEELQEEGIHFLNMPFWIKFYPFEGLYLQVGPNLGYIVDWSFYAEPNYLIWSIDFGVGYDFNRFFIDVRFSKGTTQVMLNGWYDGYLGTNGFYDANQSINNLSLNIGWKF